MHPSTLQILCVASEARLARTQSEILRRSGYNTLSASFNEASNLLASKYYDVVVISDDMRAYEITQIVDWVDRARIIVLTGLTLPTDLLTLVRETIG